MDDFEHLNDVEGTLYQRMRRNSFKGAVKAAIIGGVIAVVVGAALGALIFSLPITLAHAGLLGAMAAGAAAVSAVVVPLAARLGGTAGIQSTRDARRFMQADRLPELTPSETQEKQQILALNHPAGTPVFQERLARERSIDPVSNAGLAPR